MGKSPARSLWAAAMAATGFIVCAGSAQATLYSVDLGFSTSNQSMWSTGSAYVLDRTKTFANAPWNGSVSVGGFTLGTGLQASASTSGHIGLQYKMHADSGSVNVNYPVSVNLDFPDPGSINAGETFSIATSYALKAGASLITQSPVFSFQLNALYNLYAAVSGKACVTYACKSGSKALIKTGNKSFSLFKVDNKGLSGALTTLLDASSAALELKSTLSDNANKDDKNKDPAANKDSKKTKLTDYLKTIDVSAGIPDIYTVGGVGGDGKSLVSSGEDDFLDVTMDLDKVLTTLAGLPPVTGTNIDLVFAKVGYDIIDAHAGAVVAATQDFSLSPTLQGTLTFDQDVVRAVQVLDHVDYTLTAAGQFWKDFLYPGWSDAQFCQLLPTMCTAKNVYRTEYVTGRTFDYNVGDTLDFQLPDGVDSVSATPAFRLNAQFTNQTGLRIDPVIRERLLGVDFEPICCVDPFHKDVFHAEQRFDVGANIPLFDRTFTLQGFDGYVTTPFALATYGLPGGGTITGGILKQYDVPEPGVLWLLLLGLPGLWLQRRIGSGRCTHA